MELQEGDSAMSINTLKFSVAVGFACATTLGLTACSNSDDPNGSSAKETALSVEVLGKTVGDTLVFDMMDSTYDFKIKADGNGASRMKRNLFSRLAKNPVTAMRPSKFVWLRTSWTNVLWATCALCSLKTLP